MNRIPWRNKQREVQPGELSPLSALRADVDRLFEAFVREPFGAIDWPFGRGDKWTPRVDITQSDQEITVRAEVPGIAPEDLDVTVSGQQLILSGEKREATKHEDKDVCHAESRYGSFRRSIPLPETVDPQQVRAEYANGILTVHLTKSPAATPQRIDVKLKDE